jgi:peptide/nickel transport system ATP-binding protein
MYPFQLSGGQNQRIMIAQGIICGPDLLIADEPTSSVDVALRKVILDMLKEINRKTGMAVLLITHDFEVINYICDRVVVMYGGLIMEEGPMAEVMSNPLHPYTKALTYCARSIYQNGSELFTLSGAPPTPAEFKLECPFTPRCAFKRSSCMFEIPMMMEVDDRKVRCVLYREEYPDVRSDL